MLFAVMKIYMGPYANQAGSRSFERWPSPGRRELEQSCAYGASDSAVAGQVHGCVSQASTQRTSPAEQRGVHSA
jgi:hypothetical protein